MKKYTIPVDKFNIRVLRVEQDLASIIIRNFAI